MRLSLVAAVVAVTAVALVGCSKDPGEEAFQRGRAKHLALLEAGQQAEAKGFDEVLQDLAEVPRGSKRFADAQQLTQAIAMARQHVRAPLAVVRRPDEGLPPNLQAQSDACVALAEALGRDGGATAEAVKALDACRKRMETMVRAMIHSQAPDQHQHHDEGDAGL